MAVPLYDAPALELPRGHRARHPVAILGMRRDAGYIEREVAATARRMFRCSCCVVIGVGIGVRLSLRHTVVQPLRRLLEGIDAVGKGDLSRVILAERDDEIGTIAGRFNAMTGSLREAREEGERAADARQGLEARLRHSEKLATIGQMAAEIAHELGTPLNVIGGRARALSKRVERAERRAATSAGRPWRDINRGQQERRHHHRRGRAHHQDHPPGAGFLAPARADPDPRAAGGRSSRRRWSSCATPSGGKGSPSMCGRRRRRPRCPGDPDQIQQVCLNLVTNAIQAMPNGGTLRVTTERVVRRKGGLDLAPPAEYVVLTVADTGPGIPAADRDKIFEPFFTTKDAGQGTGLGLAVGTRHRQGPRRLDRGGEPAGRWGGVSRLPALCGRGCRFLMGGTTDSTRGLGTTSRGPN